MKYIETMKLRTIGVLFMAFVAGGSAAQQLIPMPREMRCDTTRRLRVTAVDAKVNTRLHLPAEGYTLDISGSKATLRACDSRGLVWARATLRQLEGADGLYPKVSIRDWPAFPIRGFMHDVGRNFRSVEMLKRELDLFSQYKLNVFHWHLTDNPAWRIECKAYPQLNDPRFQRKGRDEGKFYTYDEIRDVIAYARQRGITVIPEIDMPGHSRFFDDTFGFSMASPEGMKVLRKCLEEFFSEISAADCPYFHIGSDEVHVDNPKEFMTFCEGIVRAHGRTPIAWNPGLEPSAGTVHQVWNSAIGDTIAAEGCSYRYIDSYQGYLNIGSPILNVAKNFMHTPCGVTAADGKAMGGILCLWNDVRVADKSLTFPQNGMPGCLLAFAERYWRGGRMLPTGDETLVPVDTASEVYVSLADFERRLAWHRDRLLYDWDMRWVANASQPWLVTLPTRRGARLDTMQWRAARGGVIDMKAFCQHHGVEVKPSMDAWMRTEIHVDADTTITAWLGFDSPGRATKMSHGIGLQGEWEAEGRLFVNGVEVLPRLPWNEPGKYRYHKDTWHQAPEEVPYTAEQFCWMRQPAYLTLRKGWNRVEIYCPRVFDAKTWQVTFIPIHIDTNGHVSEAKGLRFR